MRIIRTYKDINYLRRVRELDESFLAHVEDYFRQLQTATADDSTDDWSHHIALLESGDDISSIGMSRDYACLQSYYPEYIELHELGNDIAIYKIFVLHDNECSTTYFTQKGIHDEETEQWLKEQAER